MSVDTSFDGMPHPGSVSFASPIYNIPLMPPELPASSFQPSNTEWNGAMFYANNLAGDNMNSFMDPALHVTIPNWQSGLPKQHEGFSECVVPIERGSPRLLPSQWGLDYALPNGYPIDWEITEFQDHDTVLKFIEDSGRGRAFLAPATDRYRRSCWSRVY